ncbi:amidase domain-containing protein [Phormidium tenue FACHB-886]|nr:amidase domain-containing protein [Phormidium tenue FACHB-886]
MGVQDLISRIEIAKNNLQEARNQIPRAEHHDVDISRYQVSPYPENYDRERAVQYAKEYALKPNSQYIVFGNDCTNFASQVLIEGGVIDYEQAKDPDGAESWASTEFVLARALIGPAAVFLAEENRNPENWVWFGPEKRRLDTDFLRAARLPQYLEEKGLASLRPVDPVSKEAVHSEIRRSLKPGDLIAYENDGDPEADHVNVFLGFNEDGVPMTANHSPGQITELNWQGVKTLIHING